MTTFWNQGTKVPISPCLDFQMSNVIHLLCSNPTIGNKSFAMYADMPTSVDFTTRTTCVSPRCKIWDFAKLQHQGKWTHNYTAHFRCLFIFFTEYLHVLSYVHLYRGPIGLDHFDLLGCHTYHPSTHGKWNMWNAPKGRRHSTTTKGWGCSTVP